MKFRMLVRKEGEEESWWEEYDKNTGDPEAWAKDIISWFNDTRSSYEKIRILEKVEVLDEMSVKDHAWEKQNLVTVVGKGGVCWDVVRCKVCGITGKRYGLNESVAVDSKYKAKVYKRCDTSLNWLKRKEKRK